MTDSADLIERLGYCFAPVPRTAKQSCERCSVRFGSALPLLRVFHGEPTSMPARFSGCCPHSWRPQGDSTKGATRDFEELRPRPATYAAADRGPKRASGPVSHQSCEVFNAIAASWVLFDNRALNKRLAIQPGLDRARPIHGIVKFLIDWVSERGSGAWR